MYEDTLNLEYMLTCKIGINIIKYFNVGDVLNSSRTCKKLRSKLFLYALEHYFFTGDAIRDYHQHIRKLTVKSLNDIDKCTSLNYLKFRGKFNQKLHQGDLPQSITHLTFGYYFNQEVNQDNLPSHLTHLTFGWSFDREVGQSNLPQSITHLKFGRKFNQEVNDQYYSFNI